MTTHQFVFAPAANWAYDSREELLMNPVIPAREGITKSLIQTPRLKVNVLSSGPAAGTAVLFVHGNVSSATFWEALMLRLPDRFRALACDLRGYGETEPMPIDATLGLGDMVEDVESLVETLGVERFHLVGHSMGGGVAMKYAIAHPQKLLSLTLVDPMSPYGYSGSKDSRGTPCYDDGAPAGAGSVNPEFVRLLGEGETGIEAQFAPRNVFRQFYVKPPYVPEDEDVLIQSMCAIRIGEDHYPGSIAQSEHWPTVAPGTRGVVNAFSRKYFDASAFASISPKPPVLWIRGADDLIVSNNAMFDIQALGALGAVPGWPGNDECPPQPMIDQTEAVLSEYESGGGTVTRVVIPDSGHSPYVDKPQEFDEAFLGFLGE